MSCATLFIACLAVVFSAAKLDAQITGQFREVTVAAMARDAIFDEDDVIVGDFEDSILDGLFDESLGVNASTITGCTFSQATQTSIIDSSNHSFFAFSEIETRSTEDGTSSNSASSIVRIEFVLPIGGEVDLSQLEFSVQRSQINKNPEDDEFERSDDGSLSVVVEDEVMEFFNRTLVIERDDLGDDLSSDQTIQLPAGTYSLVVKACIFGDDVFNTVQGQPRGSNLSFCVAGTVSPDLLGDVNCDGAVNLLDVQPFVDMLSQGGFSAKADTNFDAKVDLLDVSGFVKLLSGK